ncbi:MAG: ABC transporter substrate-binding protein, partial [Plantibacter flavus]
MSIVRRSVCALAWLTAITVALSAAIPSAGAASQKPRSGGTATFLVSGDAVSLDNVRLTAPGGTGSNTAALFVYDSLVTIDPITNKPMMRLAQSLKSSPDAKVWTLKLRAGLTFSDGTPLDAAAVVANWDRHKIPALASTCNTTVANLGTYEAQGATTVVVTLPQARVGFPVLLGQCLGQIQSPTAVAKYGATYGSTPESVVGAGPYVVKDWVRGSQMTLTRNPNYWDKPRPYIDTMVLKPVTDAAQKLSAFQLGQADFAYFVSLDEQVAGLKAQGATLYGYPPAGGGADIAFNQSVPGLDDVRIRRALVLATDPA